MFGFSELEEALLSDKGPEVAVRTLNRLEQLRDRIKALDAAGLAPDEYEDAQALLSAITACEQILLDTKHMNGIK